MSDKIKNLVVSLSFILVILFFFLGNLVMPDAKLSVTERRKLAQFPKLTINKLLNRKF